MDEFYNKFPSYNQNSKECRRHNKLQYDYQEYLRTKNDNVSSNQTAAGRRATKIPVPKIQQREFDVFSVEERNRRAENESKEKMIHYQRVLLQQIEEAKMNKKLKKDQEKENERILEERLQKQIQNMSIEQDDPVQNRLVERVSVSENDKHRSPSQNNDVYRFFSKSSISLFNYRDKYFNDLDIAKVDLIPPTCMKCHAQILLCNKCKNHTAPNGKIDQSERNASRTNNYNNSMQKYSENYVPYTFDNSVRLRKNNPDDLTNGDFQKIYSEIKRRKKVSRDKEAKSRAKNELKVHDDLDIEEMLKSGHKQYTVITGYAKSLLEKNDYLP